jgi:hypothetical protein
VVAGVGTSGTDGNQDSPVGSRLLARRCLAGKVLALVDGELVAVAVDDLPLAVLATVDLGDAQGVRLDRDAVDRQPGLR